MYLLVVLGSNWAESHADPPFCVAARSRHNSIQARCKVFAISPLKHIQRQQYKHHDTSNSYQPHNECIFWNVRDGIYEFLGRAIVD